MKNVSVYTDGACSGNPGPGGYGVILEYNGKEKELSGGYRKTTNNRMELMAVIVGLEALKEPCEVQLYSDSSYVINALTQGWVYAWKKNNWRRKGGEAQNPDLWQRLLDATAEHKIEYIWVKGHNGNEKNERCDTLAVSAYKSENLPPDTEYENRYQE